MRDLFADIATLSEQDLSIEEVFYYAALIHLVFVHIHPFADGNGRSARLFEKWFIVSHLGKAYWKLPSEYYYKENRSIYYDNINL
jgi:Fic family protein